MRSGWSVPRGGTARRSPRPSRPLPRLRPASRTQRAGPRPARGRGRSGGTSPSRRWRATADCTASSGSSRSWASPTPHARANSPRASRRSARSTPRTSRSISSREARPPVERFQGQLRHAAQSSAPVWLVGEPGSGKETAARVIHHAGPHRDRAFVGIDCAGLQPFLIESLLFGHGGLFAVGAHRHALPQGPGRAAARSATEARGLTSRRRRTRRGSSRVRRDPRTRTWRRTSSSASSTRCFRCWNCACRRSATGSPTLRGLHRTSFPVSKVDADALDVLRVQNWAGNLRELADALARPRRPPNGAAVKREHLPREFRVRAGIEPPRRSAEADHARPDSGGGREAADSDWHCSARTTTRPRRPRCSASSARLWRRLEALGIPVPATAAEAAEERMARSSRDAITRRSSSSNPMAGSRSNFANWPARAAGSCKRPARLTPRCHSRGGNRRCCSCSSNRRRTNPRRFN